MMMILKNTRRSPAIVLLALALGLALPAAEIAAVQEAPRIQGKVTATMDSGGYTYVEIETNGKKIWAAAPITKVKIGEKVELVGAMAMTNFTSQTLKRTFDEILFVGAILGEGAAAAPGTATGLPAGHMAVPAKNVRSSITVAPGSIVKAEKGQTVQECFARKADLKGKTVRIRGRVVKFNPEILDLNWIHLQDGTGAEGTNDLTITTKDQAQAGDLVLVTGTLVLDKDLGSGYFFPVLVENAKIQIEAKRKD